MTVRIPLRVMHHLNDMLRALADIPALLQLITTTARTAPREE